MAGIEELNPSHLGTKEHWDAEYTRELKNFQDFGDIGEVWFGHQCQTRLANWLDRSCDVTHESCIVDIGCGNGALLVELAKRGYKELNGIDYSFNAIELAKQIAVKEEAIINFMLGNIVDVNTLQIFKDSVDVCLDKGTYDAISLDPDDAKIKRKYYQKSILSLLKSEGLLLLASCNWTEDELKVQFNDGFVSIDTIPSPSFNFGGKVGQTVSTVVFKKSQKPK